MPVHNGGIYLESAIRSVMTQTLRDIEIVVVDDGSTDDTPALLERLSREDSRLVVSRLSPNRRISGALNHGLGLVRAPLVARMDADDLCRPERLEVQKRYMDAHPDVVLLGSSFNRMAEDGTHLRVNFDPRDAYMCRWTMRWFTPVMHPTVMFRHPMPDGTRMAYDSAFDYAEDLEIYTRMVRHGGMVDLPDTLLDYRMHQASTSGQKKAEQWQLLTDICTAFIESELPAPVVEALRPVLRTHFGFSKEPPALLFAGLRAMLRHDLANAPHQAFWLRRRTAELAFALLNKAGRGKYEKMTDFAGPGRDFAPFLAANRAYKRLPQRFRTQDVRRHDGAAEAMKLGRTG